MEEKIDYNDLVNSIQEDAGLFAAANKGYTYSSQLIIRLDMSCER